MLTLNRFRTPIDKKVSLFILSLFPLWAIAQTDQWNDYRLKTKYEVAFDSMNTCYDQQDYASALKFFKILIHDNAPATIYFKGIDIYKNLAINADQAHVRETYLHAMLDLYDQQIALSDAPVQKTNQKLFDYFFVVQKTAFNNKGVFEQYLSLFDQRPYEVERYNFIPFVILAKNLHQAHAISKTDYQRAINIVHEILKKNLERRSGLKYTQTSKKSHLEI